MTSINPTASEPSATEGTTGSVIPPTPHDGAASVPAYAPSTAAPYAYGSPLANGAFVGKVRGTGACIALSIVTLGIYNIIWFYNVHSEMKNHTGGAGIGGGLAAVLALFVSIVMPFVTSSEVGNVYRRAGMAAPVSGATGLWFFPGMFILIGPLVWFIKTNAAINSYWRSLGAV